MVVDSHLALVARLDCYFLLDAIIAPRSARLLLLVGLRRRLTLCSLRSSLGAQSVADLFVLVDASDIVPLEAAPVGKPAATMKKAGDFVAALHVPIYKKGEMSIIIIIELRFNSMQG